MSERIITAAVLIIGNEILSGRTQDVNLNYLAKRLGELGVRLMEARIVPDVDHRIVKAVNELRAAYDYVFTTGGIGPTHDDITSESLAKAFGVPHILHPEAHALMAAHYAPGQLNAARLRMAMTPEGAELVTNPISKAPGYRIGNVHVLAGVPKIMQAMFEGMAHQIKGGKPVKSRSISSGVFEGALAADLKALQEKYAELDLGSYPSYSMGQVRVAIVMRGTDEARLAACAEEWKATIVRLGGTPVED
ncbi:MAG: competence/damage-inducible protein A [Alphaproteobacteria bacterium]|nr:competence/damage-inducible protein A [Alphaproteobacteria bacterium]